MRPPFSLPAWPWRDAASHVRRRPCAYFIRRGNCCAGSPLPVFGIEPLKHAFLRSAAASALAALALVAAPSAAGAAELLVNGSFDDIGAAQPEGWGGLTYYAGGQWAIPGWT